MKRKKNNKFFSFRTATYMITSANHIVLHNVYTIIYNYAPCSGIAHRISTEYVS